MTTRIEILHVRDADMGCEHAVWIDGEPATNVTIDIEDIDPGRGYVREEWMERAEPGYGPTDRSPAFQDAVRAAVLENAENTYID